MPRPKGKTKSPKEEESHPMRANLIALAKSIGQQVEVTRGIEPSRPGVGSRIITQPSNSSSLKSPSIGSILENLSHRKGKIPRDFMGVPIPPEDKQ
jgi:hypothetical protein